MFAVAAGLIGGLVAAVLVVVIIVTAAVIYIRYRWVVWAHWRIQQMFASLRLEIELKRGLCKVRKPDSNKRSGPDCGLNGAAPDFDS